MRFFDYSAEAPEKFKSELENKVKLYDRVMDANAYTAPAAGALVTLLMIIQTILSNMQQEKAIEYTNGFNPANIAITSLSISIVMILKTVIQRTENAIKQLIADGVNNHYFKTIPNDPVEDLEEGMLKQQQDATIERILRRR